MFLINVFEKYNGQLYGSASNHGEDFTDPLEAKGIGYPGLMTNAASSDILKYGTHPG